MANLAAFLTKSGVLDYVGTMDEVKAKGKKVCDLPALKTELEISHPTATFVFSQAGKSYYGLIDDYDAKRCDFIAIGKEDAKSNIELMNMFCQRNVCIVAVPVLLCSINSHILDILFFVIACVH